MTLGNARCNDKDNQIPNFIKIRPVVAELFHTDGRTDMMKLTVGFRNFANAPKNSPDKLSLTYPLR